MDSIPLSPSPSAAPKSNRRTLIIAAVVGGLFLCCCCALVAAVAGWYCGDILTGLSSTCAPFP